MKDGDEPVEYDCVEVLHETERAWLCNVDGSEVWIPKSQLLDDSDPLEAGTDGVFTIVVPMWLAVEKGIA
jgi:hypothetical protein